MRLLYFGLPFKNQRTQAPVNDGKEKDLEEKISDTFFVIA